MNIYGNFTTYSEFNKIFFFKSAKLKNQSERDRKRLDVIARKQMHYTRIISINQFKRMYITLVSNDQWMLNKLVHFWYP